VGWFHRRVQELSEEEDDCQRFRLNKKFMELIMNALEFIFRWMLGISGKMLD
jgi:hypothetical protein